MGEINDNNGSSQQESETFLIGKKEGIPWGHETTEREGPNTVNTVVYNTSWKMLCVAKTFEV